jgi:hypothetical protein
MKTQFGRKSKLLVIYVICFLGTLFFFQNCSQIKNAGLQAENGILMDSPDNSLSGGTRRVIAPVSNSGNPGSSAVNPQGDEVMLLKEYRHKSIERYFLTTRASDQQMIETGVLKNSLSFTGNTFSVYKNQIAGSSPLCRFYNSVEQTHLYTADQVECNQLKAIAGMSYEGVEGYVININKGASCPANTVPVYKAYDNTSALSMKRHRLTADFNLVNRLVRDYKWVYDSIGFCVSQLSLVDSQITTPVPTNPVVTNPPAPPNPQPPANNTCVKPARFANVTTDICEDFGPFPADVIEYCNCKALANRPAGQASCDLNGTPVQHGQSITAYLASSVPAGSTCSSQSRTCNNGNLTGTFSYNSCVVGSVNPTPGPPSPPVSTAQCPNDYLLYDWGLVNSQKLTDTSTRDVNGNRHLFGARNLVVFKMTVSSSMTSIGRSTLPRILFIEEPSFNETAKVAVISRSPCNFSNPEYVMFKQSDYSQGGWVTVRINEPNKRSGVVDNGPNLTTGVWFLSIKNFDTEQSVYGPDAKFNVRASFLP